MRRKVYTQAFQGSGSVQLTWVVEQMFILQSTVIQHMDILWTFLTVCLFHNDQVVGFWRKGGWNLRRQSRGKADTEGATHEWGNKTHSWLWQTNTPQRFHRASAEAGAQRAKGSKGSTAGWQWWQGLEDLGKGGRSFWPYRVRLRMRTLFWMIRKTNSIKCIEIYQPKKDIQEIADSDVSWEETRQPAGLKNK